MKIREVLSIQGPVFVINARGVRRVLHQGDRLNSSDRLELGEGSQLTLRDADGHEEKLQGAEPFSAAAELTLAGGLPAESAPPGLLPLPRSHAPKRLVRALMDHARPEAGLLSDAGVGGQHNGHDFIRIERTHQPVPHSTLEASTGPRGSQDERLSELSGSGRSQEWYAAVAWQADPRSEQPIVLPSGGFAYVVPTAYLLEGADRTCLPSLGRHTGLSQQRVTLPAPLWGADGHRLLLLPGDASLYDSDTVDPSLHSVTGDKHVTLEIRCLGIVPGGAASAPHYEYLLTHRGRMAMENIPEGAEVVSHWRLRAQDGAIIGSAAVTVGNVDSSIGQEHEVIENDPIMLGAHDPEIEEIDAYGRPVFPDLTPHAVLAPYLPDPERMPAG